MVARENKILGCFCFAKHRIMMNVCWKKDLSWIVMLNWFLLFATSHAFFFCWRHTANLCRPWEWLRWRMFILHEEIESTTKCSSVHFLLRNCMWWSLCHQRAPISNCKNVLTWHHDAQLAPWKLAFVRGNELVPFTFLSPPTNTFLMGARAQGFI